MLTGSPVFTGESVMEICMRHIKEAPVPPSIRSGKPVNADLESLLLRCLAKKPADRPANAAELLRALEACVLTEKWTSAAAAAWWQNHQHARPSGSAELEPTRISDTPGSTMSYEK